MLENMRAAVGNGEHLQTSAGLLAAGNRHLPLTWRPFYGIVGTRYTGLGGKTLQQAVRRVATPSGSHWAPQAHAHPPH